MRLKIQKDVLICLRLFKEMLNVGKDLLTLLKIKYVTAIFSLQQQFVMIICYSICA